ncbi:response regulator [Clostridioides difficile CD160]|uniref:LytR/AlgR family response regulator transcription factor n=1 Tax=unclassified Clostridioides TaxID=2635829 RepID=UPI00038CE495|nr:response regulator [Clostridioides difficile CD160]MCC0642398.1 response regulator transcription factor [Clostridioides sp. ES-S-0049-03]MCC0678431.1 response regulator transcription factor [Clostridioides sp. ES-W-0018-02]MCC0682516.1 response regulator transcription factor [Clostridioides sp. ES-S-0005-03]MCC0713258.1 response regulator transcription factor [Clostridioides sp. ES-W-0017-02]NJI80587.1 response regulator transcription factor [Clostridioides difficile]
MVIIICENDDMQRDIIHDFIKIFLKKIKIKQYEVLLFKNVEELLEKDSKKVDLVLMDLNLEDKNEFEISKEIRKRNKNVKIIFTTESNEDVVKEYEINAFRYLIKPIYYKNFEKIMIDFAIDWRKREAVIYIKKKKKIIIIEERDILFAEIVKRKLKVITKTDEYIINEKLDIFEEKLKEGIFFRCHKSYLINLLQVNNLNYNFVYLTENNIKIKVAPRKAKELKFYLSNILRDRIW